MLLAAIIIWGIISNSLADDPTWKVDKKVQQYGEDVTLLCVVSNCCNKSAGWGKYTSTNEFNTIFIDVKDLNVDGDSKYDGGLNKTGFFLIIRNITRNDLNVSYSCTYGFLVSRKMLLLETNAFDEKKENKPDIRNRDINSKNQDNSSISAYVAVGICIGVAGLAPIIIYVIYRKGLFPRTCLFNNICSNELRETEKASVRPNDRERSEGSSESLINKERPTRRVNNKAHTVKQGLPPNSGATVLRTDSNCSYKSALNTLDVKRSSESLFNKERQSMRVNNKAHTDKQGLLPDSDAIVQRTDSNCSYKSALNTLHDKRVMRNASSCSNFSALSYKTCTNGEEITLQFGKELLEASQCVQQFLEI